LVLSFELLGLELLRVADRAARREAGRIHLHPEQFVRLLDHRPPLHLGAGDQDRYLRLGFTLPVGQ
jgi:hypothetical protein